MNPINQPPNEPAHTRHTKVSDGAYLHNDRGVLAVHNKLYVNNTRSGQHSELDIIKCLDISSCYVVRALLSLEHVRYVNHICFRFVIFTGTHTTRGVII